MEEAEWSVDEAPISIRLVVDLNVKVTISEEKSAKAMPIYSCNLALIHSWSVLILNKDRVSGFLSSQ